MKNKSVGLLMVMMAILMGLIIFLFNRALIKIVGTSCSHGASCPMYGTINTQTYISMALVGIIIIIGLVLFFNKEERAIIKKIIKGKTKKEHKIEHKLTNEEKKIIDLIKEAEGTIFQSELVEKSGFTKVKITRILDKLEGKQVIQRMRRGMTNVVILK